MRANKAPGFRRRRLSVTSLIDIIFLLLLFFMLSSTFSHFAEVEILSAGAGEAAPAFDKPPLFLRLQAEGLSLNGETATLETLAAAVQSRVDVAIPQMLLVSLNGKITAQRLVDLLVVLRPINGITVQVLEAG